MITDDAVVFGLLSATLGLVFWTSRSSHPAFKAFYRVVPALLLCYCLPAFYNTVGLIDGGRSELYFVSSRYLLPATLVLLTIAIGMQINLRTVLTNPGLFVLGAVRIVIHAVLMVTVARAIRAPIFYLAVASQANIGGAASAPVVASAFHPSLAPVGVLLAVLGYALGTYGGWLSGQLRRLAGS